MGQNPNKANIIKLSEILTEISNDTRHIADTFQKNKKWSDEDSRMYFFNVVSQSCILNGMTLFFINNEIIENKNKWREKQLEIKIDNIQEFDLLSFNYLCKVRNDFFLEFLIYLEHSLRIFWGNINPKISCENISNIKDQIIKQLKLDEEYKKLFDIIFKIRNTIHTGGLISKSPQTITYKGKAFEFVEKKETQTSSLENIDFLLKEVIEFMKMLFNHETSLKIEKMEHPYVPIFKKK